jgi:hypothetical protein
MIRHFGVTPGGRSGPRTSNGNQQRLCARVSDLCGCFIGCEDLCAMLVRVLKGQASVRKVNNFTGKGDVTFLVSRSGCSSSCCQNIGGGQGCDSW